MANRKIADIVEDKKFLVLPEHQTCKKLVGACGSGASARCWYSSKPLPRSEHLIVEAPCRSSCASFHAQMRCVLHLEQLTLSFRQSLISSVNSCTSEGIVMDTIADLISDANSEPEIRGMLDLANRPACRRCASDPHTSHRASTTRQHRFHKPFWRTETGSRVPQNLNHEPLRRCEPSSARADLGPRGAHARDPDRLTRRTQTQSAQPNAFEKADPADSRQHRSLRLHHPC